MENKLAIVIPAYKALFLNEVLESMVSQNNKDFSVYIGDDASPEDLKSIVDVYADRLDLVYVRFEENLGSNSLVEHWNRCIRLSSEPLVWLFSDDDLMPADAVDRLFRAVHQYGEKKVFFRFPLSVVNQRGEVKYSNPPFESDRITGYDFLLDKLSGKISSAACEYVFSRDVWQETGGFIHFPLAWCSDDATWAKFAQYAGGIISLPGRSVGWRNADGVNISNSAEFDREKIQATAMFLKWIIQNFPSQVNDKKLHRALIKYVHTILTCSVRGHYTHKDLMYLCSVVARFSWYAAFRLYRLC